MKKCKEVGCEGKFYAKERCRKHYLKQAYAKDKEKQLLRNKKYRLANYVSPFVKNKDEEVETDCCFWDENLIYC